MEHPSERPVVCAGHSCASRAMDWELRNIVFAEIYKLVFETIMIFGIREQSS